MPERGDNQGVTERFSINNLRQQWTSLVAELSPTADPGKVASAFDGLVLRYSEPTRAYHTLEHISEMLTLINSNADNLSSPNQLRVATWFHDVIYDSKASDNEEQSAQIARTILIDLGVDARVIEQTAGYILATKQHDLPPGVNPNSDLAFFLDADMSILASERTRYEEYSQGVAFEYSWAQNVDGKDLYTPGRLQFLQGAIGKPIFHTDRMKALEPKARENMEREIGQLQERLMLDRLSAYKHAIEIGADTEIDTTGLVGRIIRGKTPQALETLTDDPSRRIVALMDSEGLAMLLGKTGYEAMVAIGNEERHLRRKVEEGNEFWLVVFPEQSGAKLATWDNLIEMAAQKYPNIAHILRRNLDGLKTLPSPSQEGWTMAKWKAFEEQGGFDWGDVDQAGPANPNYMTEDRLLESDGGLIAVRAFVYFTLHCREQYGGDGIVYDNQGQAGMHEYIAPNLEIDKIPHAEKVRLDVQLPENTVN